MHPAVPDHAARPPHPAPPHPVGRPFCGEPDMPAIARLLVACEAHRHGEHHTLHYFALAGQQGHTRPWDARVWDSGRTSPTGRPARDLAACALLAGTSLCFHVHPQARGTAVQDAVMEWMQHRAAELAPCSPGTLIARCAASDQHRLSLLEAHDFARREKYMLRMTRPLADPLPEPEPPLGYEVRRLSEASSEEEVASFAAAFNAAMGGTTRPETWRERTQDPRTLPPLGLVGPEGEFAAVCVCRMYPLHNQVFGVREGWIEQMGTRPELRRRGLGRAALRAGLRLLRDHGADTALLETGSTNTRSQPLYLSEQFVTTAHILTLTKTLSGAP